MSVDVVSANGIGSVDALNWMTLMLSRLNYMIAVKFSILDCGKIQDQ